MATSIDNLDPIEPEPLSVWDSLFSWTGILLIGWLIWELTSEASWGVIILCCKLGWEDVRTAFWLRKMDSDGPRGKMEFWIFMAAGMWKAAFSGFVLMFVIAIISAQPAGKFNVSPEFVQATLTAFIGFPASSLATLRSLGVALWHRRKIWQSGGVHAFRRSGQWPPLATGDTNKARTFMISSFIVLVVPTIIVVLAIFTDHRPAPQANVTLLMVVLVAALIGLPVVFAAGFGHVERHLLGARPEECWGMDLFSRDALAERAAGPSLR